jgi:hypothetical protein
MASALDHNCLPEQRIAVSLPLGALPDQHNRLKQADSDSSARTPVLPDLIERGVHHS